MDCPSAHGYELTDKHPSILALVDGEVFVALGPLLDLWFRPLAGGQVWRQVLGILELVEKREGAPLDAAHTPILRRSWHVSRG